MEKERKIRTLNLVALIVAVLGLTVAFAALSKTLTINGTASVDAASFDVYLDDVEMIGNSGDAKELSEPSLSMDKTSIENIRVSLTKPGDVIAYGYDVVNDGDIDVKYDSYYLNDSPFYHNDGRDEIVEAIKKTDLTKLYPKCDWDGNGTTTNEEREKCAENIYVYSQEGFLNGAIKDQDIDFTLPAKSKLSDLANDKVALVIMYDEDSSELPKGEVEISFSFKTLWVQAN